LIPNLEKIGWTSNQEKRIALAYEKLSKKEKKIVLAKKLVERYNQVFEERY